MEPLEKPIVWNDELEKELRERILVEFRRKKFRRYQSQCNGKHGFGTAALAWSRTKPGMIVFHCRYCGLWHLAHGSREKRVESLRKGRRHV